MYKLAIPLALALFAGSSQAAPKNLLVNGSFDEPLTNQASGTWSVHEHLTGWNVEKPAGVEVRDNVAGVAYDGSNYIELDTQHYGWFPYNTNSSISQSFMAVAGQTYTLSFAFSARNIPGYKDKKEALSNEINVLITQEAAVHPSFLAFGTHKTTTTLLNETVTGTNSTSGNQWVLETYSFKALSNGKALLTFSAPGCGDTYGGALDGVSITAVPEPETYALFLAGLGLMGAVARRNRKTSSRAC